MDDHTTPRIDDEVAATPSRRRLYVLLALLGLVAVVAVWFQPQKLFLDTAVDDALPEAAAAVPADQLLPDDEMDEDMPAEAPTVTGPTDVATGQFEGRAHTTTGTARFVDLGDRTILRIDDLVTDNGPDLVLYLSSAGTGVSGAPLVEDIVDLGVLKGNLGNQNYQLPDDIDLDRYTTVVIWCRRFNVTFGVARLNAI